MTTFPTSPPALPVSQAPNNWQSTSTPGTTLTAVPGFNNQLSAGSAGVTLVGANGDDTFIAWDPGTVIVPGTGVDTVETWGSGYTLPAGIDNLTLEGSGNAFAAGNSGNNIITANAGTDTLITGGGNDILIAGTGADTFVPTQQGNSTTWIEGFNPSLDKIDLSAFGFTSFAAVQAAMTQSGSNVGINLGNGQLVMLQNESISNLTASNVTLPSGASTTLTFPSAPPSLPVSQAPNNWQSTSTPGTLTAVPGFNNQLSAGSAGVTLVGGNGDDTFIAWDPNTVIVPGTGVDTVETWGSGYALPAGVANLTLEGSGNAFATGNSGNNIITANAGTDTLTTGGGNDILIAGTGADTFVPTVQANSTTWIEGFNSSLDTINLSAYGFSSFTAVQGAMTQSGSNVGINLGNGQLLMLQNQSLANVMASNVILSSSSSGGTTGTGTTGTGSTGTGSTGSSSGGSTSSGSPVNPPGMTMTFDDEFNSGLSFGTGTASDSQASYTTYYSGFNIRSLSSNGEQEIYVDPNYAGTSGSPLGLNPFSQSNGVLTITASPTPSQDLGSLYNYPYTSGMLTTENSFSQTYGYFEIRAELPGAGQGMWPAFWLLPTNNGWPPEIDVLEQVDSPTSNIFTTIHDNSGSPGSNFNIGNTSTAFHTYGVLWTSQALTFYVDGKAMWSTPTPADMNTPMYMLMNLAVGGNWPGSPNSTTNWSQANMKVDYVRAYSLSNTAMAAPATITTSGGTVSGSGGGTTTTGSGGGTTTTGSGGGTTTTGSGGGTTTTGSPDPILSNATDPTNLSSSFTVPTLSPGTSATYTASQLGISGVASGVTVTVADSASNALTITNNGTWGGIKNVTINSPTNGIVNVNNFVDAQISLGNGGSTVTASNLMRGTISVGDGNSTISVNAKSNSTSNNTTTINAGNGSDQISFNGASNTKAVINTKNLANTITVSGQASATVNLGTGNDTVIDKSTGSLTLTGGGGTDLFEFLAGAHATVNGFQAANDTLDLHGLSASQIKVMDSGGNTFIALGNHGQIELAGVSLSANQLHLSFA